MKCPKCGFNSFEYYDSCKKCSGDLTGYKQTHSIKSIVLPLEAKEALTAELRAAENVTEPDNAAAEAHDDMFSFDLPGVPVAEPAPVNDDPFNFDEPSPFASQAHDSKSGENVFGDLLESTSQLENSPFAQAEAAPAAAVAKGGALAAGSGDIDLESFSWDETPAAAAGAAPAANAGGDDKDDFDSLFGGTKENSSK